MNFPAVINKRDSCKIPKFNGLHMIESVVDRKDKKFNIVFYKRTKYNKNR